MREVKVKLGHLYLKEEAEKGNLEKYDYDYVKIKNGKINYVKEYRSMDERTVFSRDYKSPIELIKEEEAKKIVKNCLENKLKELE